MKNYISVIKKIMGADFTNVKSTVNLFKDGTLLISSPFHRIRINTGEKFKSVALDYNTLQRFLSFFELKDIKFAKTYAMFEKEGFKGMIPFSDMEKEVEDKFFSEHGEKFENEFIIQIPLSYRKAYDRGSSVFTGTGSGVIKMFSPITPSSFTINLLISDITSGLCYYDMKETSPFEDVGVIELTKDIIFPEELVCSILKLENDFIIMRVQDDKFYAIKGIGYEAEPTVHLCKFVKIIDSYIKAILKEDFEGVNFSFKFKSFEQVGAAFELVPVELATFNGERLYLRDSTSKVEIPLQESIYKLKKWEDSKVKLFSCNFRNYISTLLREATNPEDVTVYGFDKVVLVLNPKVREAFIEGLF